MRVYHLLAAEWALDDIKRRRLKVAGFGDLNDPFELVAGELSDQGLRRRLAKWLRDIRANYGVVCFSKTWRNPVLWSHYADKHRGICLGFDVPDSLLKDISYVKSRLRVTEKDLRGDEPAEALRDRLFCTKFEHWKYEDEVRTVLPLQNADREESLYFLRFSDHLRLKEVVAGPRCLVAKKEIVTSLGDASHGIAITKARLAFGSFSVVPDRRGFPGHRNVEGVRAKRVLGIRPKEHP